ncbi:hypothetical protein PV327_011420 [Microctonus hyperodae]|uniref:Uncharacterized protein n=1 Tax=Microctonus hyperodae TaxID=165561 RepID=A0AA39FJ71_MICHY|nr:hypothetical protein PV327_011420 [Microctonus hyperodae]
MVEISPGCGFYLRKCKFSIIQLNYERDQDWRQLVREVLLDVYGSSLSNYSATGKKSKRPGINHQLFKGLYDWINSVSPLPISKTTYINAINKAGTNKRKYQCVKSQNKKQKVMTEKENVNEIQPRIVTTPMTRMVVCNMRTL